MAVRPFAFLWAFVFAAAPCAAGQVDCLVSPHRVADLAFGSPGLVRSIKVDRGDRIHAGDRLASLDTSIEEAVLDMAEAQFAATAAIDAAKAQLKFADKRLQRNRLLLAKQNLAAVQFEEAEAEFDVARMRLAELEETQRLRGLDVARARAIQAQRIILSPFDGVVVERYVSPGEYVDNKRVLTISEIDPLFIDIIAPASAVDEVKLGQPITVRLDHPAGRIVTATASVIDPFIDASSGTFRLRALLPNPQNAIVAGFRCQANLPSSTPGG